MIVTKVVVAQVLVPVYVRVTKAGDEILTLFAIADPVVLFTLRYVVLLLLHVPPVGVVANVTVVPEHTGKDTIVEGLAFTVAVVVT